MTNNQYLSYIETLESGKDITQRHRVLQAIHRGCQTLVDVQTSLTNIKMSSVSGRVSELLDHGMIEETSPGRFVPVRSEERSRLLSEMRSDAKFRKWIKQGDDNGYFRRHANQFFEER